MSTPIVVSILARVSKRKTLVQAKGYPNKTRKKSLANN